jgi:hypothetical protein
VLDMTSNEPTDKRFFLDQVTLAKKGQLMKFVFLSYCRGNIWGSVELWSS